MNTLFTLENERLFWCILIPFLMGTAMMLWEDYTDHSHQVQTAQDMWLQNAAETFDKIKNLIQNEYDCGKLEKLGDKIVDFDNHYAGRIPMERVRDFVGKLYTELYERVREVNRVDLINAR